MAVRASDLSEHDRRLLLDTLRGKLGSENYERLVELHGEDGLVDTMLAAAAQKPTGQKEQDPLVWIWFVVLWGVISVAAGLITRKLHVAASTMLSPLLIAFVFMIPSAIGDRVAARFGKGWNWPVTIALIVVAVALTYGGAGMVEGRIPNEIVESFFVAATIAAAGPAMLVHTVAGWMADPSRKRP